MNVFDVLGPVMVGPSSSHTAGVVKIGNVVRKITGETPKKINVYFHGSFAGTYKGHGSDKAIIGGILGFETDDERIRDSFSHADEAGIEYKFDTIELSQVHPNTVLVEAYSESGKKFEVQGESVGGGNIMIRRINNTFVEFTGQFDTLIITHKDVTGIISLVTNLISTQRINIGNMKNYRERKGANSIMIIETDEPVKRDISDIIAKLPNILDVTNLERLK